MIRSIFHEIFAKTEAEFACGYEVEESVRRLRQAMTQDPVSEETVEPMVGRVAPGRVVLRRKQDLQGNRGRQRFIGRFEANGEGVVLKGCFGMPLRDRLLWSVMLGWFTFPILFGGLIVVVALWRSCLAGHLPDLRDLAGGAILALFGYGLIRVLGGMLRYSKGLSKDDAGWLSARISKALSPCHVES